MNDKKIKTVFGLGLILFWGLFFLIAAISNVCDFLMYHEILPELVTFRSGNLILVHEIVKVHGLGMGSANSLLLLLAVCQLLLADCFFITLFQWKMSPQKFKAWMSLAFALSSGLFLCCVLFSEMFVFYHFNGVFFTVIIALLLSWHWLTSTLKG